MFLLIKIEIAQHLILLYLRRIMKNKYWGVEIDLMGKNHNGSIFMNWKTPWFPGDIMSLKWHHRCQIWWLMEEPNLKYLPKNECLFKIFTIFGLD